MITPHRLKISNGDGGARLKSVTKNIFREIARTKNRFFSIFTICAIGVGFFSGVRATGSDMKITADNYYDAHELFDLRVMSTVRADRWGFISAGAGRRSFRGAGFEIL